MMSKFWVISIVLICGLLGAIAQVLFKAASRDLALTFTGIMTNWRLLTGISLYGVAMVLFWVALKQDNVSRLYPLIATSYIWAAVLANRFLGERIDVRTIIGIAFVVVGAGILSYQVSH